MTKRFFVVVAAIGLIGVSLIGQAKPSIQGVWRAQEMVWVGGANPATAKNPQPYFRIYTAKHFSLVGVMSGEARRMLQPPKSPPNLTDAEKVARYEHWLPFHGQAGTYEIKGTQIVHRWLVGKGEADTQRLQTHDFKLDGNTLWLFNREGGSGAEFNVRFTRLE